MSVDRSVPGRRSVRIEAQVPGTPEQVWEAIATGPGISSWFMPCRVDGRVGGAINIEWAPGVETFATIKTWEPPHRLVAEDSGWAPNSPAVATEWVVEARGGGQCVVRVVHTMHTDSDDWNDQLEGTEGGWPVFFAVLRTYLQHFRGQRCTPIALMAQTSGSEAQAYAKMAKGLGMESAAPGKRIATSAPGAPAFAGVVESSGATKLILRVDKPTPGLVVVAASECAGAVQCNLLAYLYGDHAAAVAEREKSKWNVWLQQCFSATAAPSG